MNSIKFIKERIKSDEVNISFGENVEFFERKFDQQLQFYSSSKLWELFKNNSIRIEYTNAVTTYENGDEYKGNLIAYIHYSEDADFEYFTCERCVCDGTLLFIDEQIINILNKLVCLKTINTKKIPEQYNENPFAYDLHYTVGNFVIGTEYGDFGTDEKPWMHSRFTTMLPIKFEIKKRAINE